MKTSASILVAVAGLLGLAINVQSQGVLPKTPVDRLKDLKIKNEEIIEKQKAALIKLEDMDKQAEQMRFLTKRG